MWRVWLCGVCGAGVIEEVELSRKEYLCSLEVDQMKSTLLDLRPFLSVSE